jgi:hypothetical protein
VVNSQRTSHQQQCHTNLASFGQGEIFDDEQWQDQEYEIRRCIDTCVGQEQGIKVDTGSTRDAKVPVFLFGLTHPGETERGKAAVNNTDGQECVDDDMEPSGNGEAQVEET